MSTPSHVYIGFNSSSTDKTTLFRSLSFGHRMPRKSSDTTRNSTSCGFDEGAQQHSAGGRQEKAKERDENILTHVAPESFTIKCQP